MIYRNTALYELVNLAIYGRHHAARYRAIADLIPAGSSVVDLCCGPAPLYRRHLQHKSVQYAGLDISPVFIKSLRKCGGNGLVWDLRSDKPLPRADYVVIQGALYFFLPDPAGLIQRMLVAANKQVIIAEPIRNVSSSSVPFVSRIATKLAGGVKGDHPVRFTEETFDKLFEHYPPELRTSFKIPGERDKVYVLQKTGASTVFH